MDAAREDTVVTHGLARGFALGFALPPLRSLELGKIRERRIVSSEAAVATCPEDLTCAREEQSHRAEHGARSERHVVRRLFTLLKRIVGLEPRPALDEKQRAALPLVGAARSAAPPGRRRHKLKRSARLLSLALRHARAWSSGDLLRAHQKPLLPFAATINNSTAVVPPRVLAPRRGGARGRPSRLQRRLRVQARAAPRAARLAASIPRARARPSVRSRTKSGGLEEHALRHDGAFRRADHAELFYSAPNVGGRRSRLRAMVPSSPERFFAVLFPARRASCAWFCSEVPRERAPNEFGARRSSTSFASDDARARERSATRRDAGRRGARRRRARAMRLRRRRGRLRSAVAGCNAQASDGPSSDACAELEAWETSCSSEAARALLFSHVAPRARGSSRTSGEVRPAAVAQNRGRRALERPDATTARARS